MNTTLNKIVSENQLLQITGYFFVIKKDMVFNPSFQSHFVNDDIAVASFDSKPKAQTFKRLMEAEGFVCGKDFIEGYHADGNAHFAEECNWLDIVQKDQENFVQYNK